jgi:hypothetical protein
MSVHEEIAQTTQHRISSGHEHIFVMKRLHSPQSKHRITRPTLNTNTNVRTYTYSRRRKKQRNVNFHFYVSINFFRNILQGQPLPIPSGREQQRKTITSHFHYSR